MDDLGYDHLVEFAICLDCGEHFVYNEECPECGSDNVDLQRY